MATVYLARDLRHRRKVAIKVLSPVIAEALGPDRFAREIEIAATLTHPHILPLHDSGAVGGHLYYVMPYIDGESLADRLKREGPLPVADAVRILREIVDALGAAHAVGVVHRDIKPANVLLASGHALVTDFGVAKALGNASEAGARTETGIALGTPLYMAPEQATGNRAIDHRADIFAAGLVGYEMLTGSSPFAAPTTPAVFAAIMTEIPEHPSQSRPAVPKPLGDLVLRCLEKDPAARPQTAAQLLADLDAILTTDASGASTPRASGRRRFRMTRGGIVAALAAVVLVGLGLSRFLARRSQVEWARQVAVPEVLKLVEANRLTEAATLAFRAERILGADPVLGPMWPRMTTSFRAVTDSPGARLSYRSYQSSDDEWISLAVTPFATDRFPVGVFRFRIELEGYDPVEQARSLIAADWQAILKQAGGDYMSDPSYVLDLKLVRAGSGTPGMIEITGGRYNAVPISGFAPFGPVEIPHFLIDRTEVTNLAYLGFVEAGAYADSTLWTEPFRRDGTALPWREGVTQLTDATGRPGPSTWVLGRPPEGRDSFPVGGVSWYEASAFCRWRGKSLPTLFHWARAAIPSSDSWSPFNAILSAASNFESDGPVAVGSRHAIGVSGAEDLVGNVREWVSTASGPDRHLAGGGYNEPAYVVRDRVIASPWNRLPIDGFRCAKYLEDPPEALFASIERPTHRLTGFTPMPDAVFEPTVSLYAYDRGQPLAAQVDSSSATPTGVVIEWVSVDTPYGGRLPMRLQIPANSTPPFGAVIFFPGGNLLLSREISPPQLSFLTQAGRVVVEPVFDGGFWRNDERTAQLGRSESGRAVIRSHWVQDLGRAIDYLEQRPDVDARTVAYAGLSLGASVAPYLLPYEPRFRAAILLSGGLPQSSPQAALDRTASLAGRLRLPLLMLGGRNDFSNPIRYQEALFRAFGTPDTQKRLRTFEAGHWPYPMNEAIREMVDFLDRFAEPAAPNQ